MFPSLISFVGVDPSSYIGKVDNASLPQQALMEMLINGITKNSGWMCEDDIDNPKDISEWAGVNLNEAGEIVEIHWFNMGLAGSVNFEWLPSTVQKADLSVNKLTGTVHLGALPQKMIQLHLQYNKFSGEISLKHLPDGLEALDLGNNTLSGAIDLTSLPAGLRCLYLNDNSFSGETDFSKLPESLEYLKVCNTHLKGEIYFDKEEKNFKAFHSKVSLHHIE